jgi:hypothetical protein
MKRESITVHAIGVLALAKAVTAFMVIRATGSISNAIIPIAATILLSVAAFLVWNGKRSGLIIAGPVIGIFLLNFFLLGLVQKMFVYFLMHTIAIWAIIRSWSNLKVQRNEQDLGQEPSDTAPIIPPNQP